jgi:hypothetical protein
LIEFDSAEDRTSVVVVDRIELDSSEERLSVAVVVLIELVSAEFLSVVALWFELVRREALRLSFADALDSTNDDFAFKVCLTLAHRPPPACTVPDAVLSSLMIL